MKNVLRTLALTVMLGAASMAAQAQVRIFFGVGAPAPVYAPAYVPPSPGVDFVWAPGYYYGQVWVPGRWVYNEDYYDRGYYGYRPYYYAHRGWDHRGWDHDRGWGHRH